MLGALPARDERRVKSGLHFPHRPLERPGRRGWKSVWHDPIDGRWRLDPRFRLALAAAAWLLSGCDERETGPVRVSAIGSAAAIEEPQSPAARPALRLPGRGGRPGPGPLRCRRRDRAGAGAELDRLRRRHCATPSASPRRTGRRRAGSPPSRSSRGCAPRPSRASRNPLKPVLGAIDEFVAMTDDVLEISLQDARGPNFLQLLAQPEMAIVRNGEGSGPLPGRAAAGRIGPARPGGK